MLGEVPTVWNRLTAVKQCYCSLVTGYFMIIEYSYCNQEVLYVENQKYNKVGPFAKFMKKERLNILGDQCSVLQACRAWQTR